MPVTITTKSSTDPDLENRIYPGREDRLPYSSWLNPETIVNPTVENCMLPYHELKATGGPIVSWEIVNGSLPKGITLDGATGRMSGTPSKIGIFTFTVKATNDIGEFATKQLVFEIKPYRGRDMSMVPFAPIRQWGKGNYPYIAKNFFDTTSTPAQKGGINTMIRPWTDAGSVFHAGWEAQLEVDHEANAAYDQSLGLKFAEVCMGIDLGMFRMGPSPPEVTRFEDHATFNHVEAYANAYHASGMKIGMYIAPNYPANLIEGETGSAAYALTDGNIPFGNHPSVIRWYFTEWVKNKWLDYAFVDVGAAQDIYVENYASSAAFPMLTYIPIFRFFNDDFCFAVNPGTRTGDCRMGGAQVFYPHADGYIFEMTKATTTSEDAYEIGVPPMNRKKVFVYCWEIPGISFGHGADAVGAVMKNLEGTKRKIDECNENGCTFAAAHPVAGTGIYPTPYYQNYFEELAAHTQARGGYSSFCEFDYSRGQITITSAPDETIFYTTDGTYPTLNSLIYTGPIRIKKPTHIRARSLKTGKIMGHVEDGVFGSEMEEMSEGKVAFNINTIKNVTHVVDAANSFRGQHINVFNKDMIVEAFGRQVSGTGLTHNPELIIKRRADEFNHFFGVLDKNAPVVDGYQWIPAHGLRLKAGSRYWMAFGENSTDTYASNPMTVNPFYNQEEFLIKGNAIGSPRGDLMPLVDNIDWYAQWNPGGNYYIGQYINMRYRTVENGDPETLYDLLLGRDATMTDNAGGPVAVNGGIHVATCANNGLGHTYALAGGIYVWVWGGILEKPRWYNRVEVEFAIGSYSTQMNLYSTMSEFASPTTLIASKFDNKSSKVTFTFPKRFGNRIYLMNVLPDGPGQIGGSMALKRVSAYLK